MNQVPFDSASSSAGGAHTRTRRIAPFVWAGGMVLILVVSAGGYLGAGVAGLDGPQAVPPGGTGGESPSHAGPELQDQCRRGCHQQL
jgi:hypothetical protein